MKIDIPLVLVHLRGRVVRETSHVLEGIVMRVAGWVFRGRKRFGTAQLLLRSALTLRRPPGLGAWTRMRDLPRPPRESFRRWWCGGP